MLNPFELELQMIEHTREAERRVSANLPLVPLADWMLGLIATGAIWL